jgi:hypothetical protein
MKIGDIVKTKVPGFGTGKESKLGTIIKAKYGVDKNELLMVEVLQSDGSFHEWYPWQLESV